MSTPREQLGRRLHDLRKRADLSGDQLAARTGLSQSKVSRVEAGKSLPNISEVERWAQATGSSADELAEIAALVEQVAIQAVSWHTLHRLGLSGKQQAIAELEARVSTVRVFQPVVVPGLLQIPDYAQRVMRMGYSGASVTDEVVMARLERQRILYDLNKQFEFVITEGALRFTVGPPEVMLAQLDRLLSVAGLPNVELGIIPLSRPAAVPYMHAFQMFGDELVSVETYTAELRVQEAREVARYAEVFDALRETAESPSDALRRLVQAIAAGQER